MKKKLFASIVTAAGLAMLLHANPASATLTLQEGLIDGSGDVDNVIFNACNLSPGPALTVQGCLNTSTTTLVNFTSNENLLISGGGQAVINAEDLAFDRVTISLADATLGFSKLQFNLDVSVDSTATFSAVDQFGNVFNFGSFDLDGEGENFFTLGSIDGQVARSFTVVSTAPIQSISNLEQVRLGPAEITTQVPEPASLLLLCAGLAGLGIICRRKSE